MSMKLKRKEFTDFLIDVISTLEGKRKRNSEHLREIIESKTNEEFIAYFENFFNDDNANLTLNIEPGEDNLSMENIMKAAKKAGVELFEHLALPYLSSDPSKPIITKNKIMVGYINGRRLQQRTRKKNSTSINISKRDPRTNQVTGEDKTGRVTDLETYGLEVQGAKYALREFFGPRSDDNVSKDQMYKSLIEKGTVSLKDLTIDRHNKQSLVAASDYFTAAMLGNDLLTRTYLLPKTLQKGKQDTKGIKRKE